MGCLPIELGNNTRLFSNTILYPRANAAQYVALFPQGSLGVSICLGLVFRDRSGCGGIYAGTMPDTGKLEGFINDRY
eukprot:5310312-Pyramimonas_sp.AAC.1